MIALLLRDLKLAFRAGGGFGLGLAFFLIVTVMVPFSVGPQSELLTTIAPGPASTSLATCTVNDCPASLPCSRRCAPSSSTISTWNGTEPIGSSATSSGRIPTRSIRLSIAGRPESRMSRKNLTGPTPSMRAASTNSSGTLRKNWWKKNRAVAEVINGMIKP